MTLSKTYMASMSQKSIGLYREEDKEVWRDARDLAIEDMERRGMEDPSEGKIFAYICKAYLGLL